MTSTADLLDQRPMSSPRAARYSPPGPVGRRRLARMHRPALPVSRTGVKLKGNSVARPPLTVAVIDDDESVRKAVRRLVQSAGLSAKAFASAEEFLDAALPPPD